MKIVLIILGALVALVLIAFTVMGMQSRSGEPLGLVDGKLAPCPAKPNCVNSEFSDDADHAVEPIQLPEGMAVSEARSVFEKVVKVLGGELGESGDSYLSATFKSSLFGFVDDLELRFEGAQVQVRSASRAGYSDAGVNAKRVDALRKAVAAAF